MKLVDVPDSKSGVVHPTCRFDSGHRQVKNNFSPAMGLFCLKFIAFVYVVPKNLGYILNMRDIQMAVFCCLAHITAQDVLQRKI